MSAPRRGRRDHLYDVAIAEKPGAPNNNAIGHRQTGANFNAIAIRGAGIDAPRLPEALAGGYADTPMLRHFYPRMVARDYAPAGYARQVLKDLDMVQAAAKDLKAPLPMTAQAATLYRFVVARGCGELDAVAVRKLFDPDPL